jgi:cyanophycin synthetase
VYHSSTVMRLEVELGELAKLRTSDLGPDFQSQFNRYFPVVPPLIPEPVVPIHSRKQIRTRKGVYISEALLEAVLAVEVSVLRAMHYLDGIQYASVSLNDDGRMAAFVWETHDAVMSRRSGEIAVSGLVELIQSNSVQPENSTYEYSFLQLIRRAENRRISNSTSVMKLAAARERIPFELITRQQIRLGHGARQKLCLSTLMPSTPFRAVKLALNKRHCNLYLANLSLPVPHQIDVADADEAAAALKRIGGPVVVKPKRGNQGRGVTIGVQKPQDMAIAFQNAVNEEAGVIVEEYVRGRDYRLTVVGGEFTAALLCVPPQVQGDGVRTVQQLIQELNDEPDRDNIRLSPIRIDSELESYLDASGYTLSSIPARDALIQLRSTGHLARGGIPVDVTNLVHADNRELCERASRAVGLDVVGIDFVSPDISRSYRDIGGWIIEVNSRPGIEMHLWPREGVARDIGSAILKYLYPDPISSRVPLVLIAGDQGTESVAHFAERMLRDQNMTVGLSLKQSAYINGTPVDTPKSKLVHASSILLRDPSVDALITTASLRKITRHGLGVEDCDVVSLTSLHQDKFDDEKARGLSALIRANRGKFVVSSRNWHAREMLSGLDRSRIVLVAAAPNGLDVRDHVEANGSAVIRDWPENGPGLRLSLVEEGERIISVTVHNLAGAEPRRVEAAMHAFALTQLPQVERDRASRRGVTDGVSPQPPVRAEIIRLPRRAT